MEYITIIDGDNTGDCFFVSVTVFLVFEDLVKQTSENPVWTEDINEYCKVQGRALRKSVANWMRERENWKKLDTAACDDDKKAEKAEKKARWLAEARKLEEAWRRAPQENKAEKYRQLKCPWCDKPHLMSQCDYKDKQDLPKVNDELVYQSYFERRLADSPYLDKMAKPYGKKWAGEYEIVAAACLLQRSIIVYVEEEGGTIKRSGGGFTYTKKHAELFGHNYEKIEPITILYNHKGQTIPKLNIKVVSVKLNDDGIIDLHVDTIEKMFQAPAKSEMGGDHYKTLYRGKVVNEHLGGLPMKDLHTELK